MPRWLRMFLILSVLAGVVPAVQAADQAVPARKVRVSVRPEYPEVAKRMVIRGAVQLRVKVSPDGDVRGIEPTGSNPVLVEAAMKAVRKWRYEPMGKETVEPVRFIFQ